MAGFYHITTFGCQMNKNDSERLSGLLNSLGLESTGQPEQADLLFVNTCSVRQHAEDRVFGLVRNWQKLRLSKPNLIIGVTGCLPGRDKDGKLKEKISGADLFFGIEEMIMLPKWLKELNPDLIGANVSGDSEDLSDYFFVNPARENKAKAFITIQTGCNNFCTYCVVPYARGREKNRPAKSILKEIQTAAAAGCKEVTLLGQTVNNYKYGNYDFVDLLQDVNKIDGIERINWTAADPQYFNGRQIEALTLPKQMNYLHLPAQSGDNEILKKMNRKYTREDYIDLIKKIRAMRPEIAIGTDLIVGFCGETEEQFANTLDLYKQCDFDISYHAMYSSRSGTAAAKAFEDDVSKEDKKRRWRAVQDLMEEIVYRKNQKYLRQTVSVLVERCANGVCEGNSNEMKLIQFPGAENLIGQIVNVKITRPEMWVLRGVST